MQNALSLHHELSKIFAMRKLSTLFSLLLFLSFNFAFGQKSKSSNPAPPKAAKIVKSTIAKKAAVSTAHPEATKVGLDILKKGGNAVDAAVAIQLALAVVYPRAGNIGGGGFMVLRKSDGSVFTYDYRERAPGMASKDMYIDTLGNPIPKLSVSGHLAAGVPGTIDGLITTHMKHGKLEFKELVQPAIDLAKKGFYLTEKDAAVLNKHMEDMKKYSLGRVAFYKGKKEKWAKKDILVQRELGNTLKRIKDFGRAGFYEGETAQMIVEDMKVGGGIISLEDLASYKTVERAALEFDYKDYHIISMGPPSSGGICLAQILQMVEEHGLDKMKFHSREAVHLMVEAERRAYSDRATHLGDPDFWTIPNFLVNKKYLAHRMKDFNAEESSSSRKMAGGEWNESPETTHLSVVDEEGNAVAVTTTLNSNFGCKVVVNGAGFLLNNEMDDFSVKPGVPNQFGLVGNEANEIKPGKRMLSSMTPTIVTKNGKLFMVLGTPGGATIITSVFQVIVNVVDFKMTLKKAVEAPRFHHQWLPNKLFIEEKGLPEDVIKKLEEMGHEVEVREPIGLMDAIMVRPDGKLEAVGDIRGDDTALGY